MLDCPNKNQTSLENGLHDSECILGFPSVVVEFNDSCCVLFHICAYSIKPSYFSTWEIASRFRAIVRNTAYSPSSVAYVSDRKRSGVVYDLDDFRFLAAFEEALSISPPSQLCSTPFSISRVGESRHIIIRCPSLIKLDTCKRVTKKILQNLTVKLPSQTRVSPTERLVNAEGIFRLDYAED